eukprot:4980651-Alexandrium_andersonii.AAC.1
MLAKSGAVNHSPYRFSRRCLPRGLRRARKVSFAAVATEAPLAPGGRAPGFPEAMLARILLVEQGEREATSLPDQSVRFPLKSPEAHN